MFRRYATCLTLGVIAAAASTATLAREYVDERGGPVYVEPAPPVAHARSETLVASTRQGWHGDRYWDGHRWWERDEWNRHHHPHHEQHHNNNNNNHDHDHDHDENHHG